MSGIKTDPAKPTAYLAGKMRGLPNFGFDLFERYTKQWREQGYDVWSPAECDLAGGFDPSNLYAELLPLSTYMERDLPHVARCDIFLLIPGWETSEGANIELDVALRLKKPVLCAQSGATLSLDGEDFRQTLTLVRAVVGTGEVRVVDPATGGEKCSKEQRFDLIPSAPLWTLAEVYGRGATKYADRNWEKGYRWGLSFAACMRHLWLFWRREDNDKETGLPHLAHAAWHCLTLLQFSQDCDKYGKLDDRP